MSTSYAINIWSCTLQSIVLMCKFSEKYSETKLFLFSKLYNHDMYFDDNQ